ncbi:MAG: carbon starvation CstA family protein [Muribaculaceae bacterium]|nr:carbon starvation CstA family protein [Muribaculaceae bacterium]
MTSFLISLAILIGGYFIYGALAEKIFGTDPRRATPAMTRADGVDYIPMPTWKVFMIQFLNIAGLGPIFGAIMGAMFGPAAFLWIVLGTIFAGGVHDFLSAMMSLRAGGMSLPEIIGEELGQPVRQVMRVFSVLLLILVGAVFVVTPSGLIASMTPEWMNATFWIAAIFIYYIAATMLPIDKLIGNLYPLFGGALLFMAVALMCVLLFGDVTIPDGFSDGLYNRHPAADTHTILPMLFVTIACGALSGFHATQSPMMARCLKNERMARPVFYGAMVAEGIVALIWAAATIAFTGGYEGLADYMAQDGHSAGSLVSDISMEWLGTFGGILAIIGVVAAPITTGDTALRSARLMVADMTRFSQRKLWRRALLSLPIFAVTFALMLMDFNVLWRYFAWCNQTLAMFTLWGITVYLTRRGKAYWISLIPAVFMTVVCVSYLLIAPRPEGIGLSQNIGLITGSAVAVLLLGLFVRFRLRVGAPLSVEA